MEWTQRRVYGLKRSESRSQINHEQEASSPEETQTERCLLQETRRTQGFCWQRYLKAFVVQPGIHSVQGRAITTRRESYKMYLCCTGMFGQAKQSDI